MMWNCHVWPRIGRNIVTFSPSKRGSGKFHRITSNIYNYTCKANVTMFYALSSGGLKMWNCHIWPRIGRNIATFTFLQKEALGNFTE